MQSGSCRFGWVLTFFFASLEMAHLLYDYDASNSFVYSILKYVDVTNYSLLCCLYMCTNHHHYSYRCILRPVPAVFQTRRNVILPSSPHNLTVLLARILSPNLMNKNGIGTISSDINPNMLFPHPYPIFLYMV